MPKKSFLLNIETSIWDPSLVGCLMAACPHIQPSNVNGHLWTLPVLSFYQDWVHHQAAIFGGKVPSLTQVLNILSSLKLRDTVLNQFKPPMRPAGLPSYCPSRHRATMAAPQGAHFCFKLGGALKWDKVSDRLVSWYPNVSCFFKNNSVR